MNKTFLMHTDIIVIANIVSASIVQLFLYFIFIIYSGFLIDPLIIYLKYLFWKQNYEYKFLLSTIIIELIFYFYRI